MQKMTCCLMQHFIRVFTVCQSTCLPVSRMKGVNMLNLSLFEENVYPPSTGQELTHHALEDAYHLLSTTCR